MRHRKIRDGEEERGKSGDSLGRGRMGARTESLIVYGHADRASCGKSTRPNTGALATARLGYAVKTRGCLVTEEFYNRRPLFQPRGFASARNDRPPASMGAVFPVLSDTFFSHPRIFQQQTPGMLERDRTLRAARNSLIGCEFFGKIVATRQCRARVGNFVISNARAVMRRVACK